MISAKGFARSYVAELTKVLGEIQADSISEVISILIDSYRRRCRVFVIGNGGSAATASHMAVDLGKTVLADAPPDAERFNVTALTDNVPWITAIANDINYDAVFSEQLRNLVSAGDLVIAITGSGNSPNIVHGVQTARALGAATVAFLGFDGGQVRDIVDHFVLIPSNDYGYIEDAHLVLNHMITGYLKLALSPDATGGSGRKP